MKAIITVSANASQNEQTCIGPNELTRQLVSKPCVEQLIKYMLGGGNPLTVGVGIVIEVIRKNNSDYDPDVGADPNAAPSSRDPIYLGTLLRLFAEHVPNFMNLIMNAPAQKERLNSTFGDKIEPLGFDRFKTCELMAELLHCSNMGLLNEVGAEEVIAARDAERQRLRIEGKLLFLRGDDVPSSAEDLTMRISHSSPAQEGRRLEVTNISAEDDGFEEVTHAGDEDTSHEFVRAEEDIPDLPDASTAPPTTSFIDKDDDDFVDEPLSSPRLKVQNLGEKTADRSFEDPDLVVAPLSPTKPKPVEDVEKSDAQDAATEETGEKIADLSLDDISADEEKLADISEGSELSETPAILTPTTSEPAEKELQVPEESKEKSPTPEAMSPHPDDTPAPLFSTSNTTPSVEAPKDDDTAENEKTVEESQAKEDINEPEPGESSIIVGRATGPGPSTESPLNPVVGDYLKMQFVEYRVVPTILSFFFKYPWNNFLHNVVYDIVQQVFNGPMDRGYNPTLAISLFEAADITAQIINGQAVCEQSQAQTRTRMGYMGHLTLIAEEVVKFTERHPPELLSETVLDRVMAQDWINYVEGALAETRERDNAILGGVRPEVAMSNRAGGASGLSGVGLSSLGLSGLGGAGGGGGGSQGAASNALAEAGLNGGLDMGEGGSGIGPFAISAGTLMSGFGSSSDEEEDEEQDSEEDVNNEVSYPLHRWSQSPYISFDSLPATGSSSGAPAGICVYEEVIEGIEVEDVVGSIVSTGGLDSTIPRTGDLYSTTAIPCTEGGDEDAMETDESLPARTYCDRDGEARMQTSTDEQVQSTSASQVPSLREVPTVETCDGPAQDRTSHSSISNGEPDQTRHHAAYDHLMDRWNREKFLSAENDMSLQRFLVQLHDLGRVRPCDRGH
jgi:SIT4-associating protein SAP185/190